MPIELRSSIEALTNGVAFWTVEGVYLMPYSDDILDKGRLDSGAVRRCLSRINY